MWRPGTRRCGSCGGFWLCAVGDGRVVVGDDLDGFVGVVGPLNKVHVEGVDGFAFDEGLVDEGLEVLPEVGAHDDDGEAFDFFGLDEDECFEDFIHGAEAAGHDDECFGVFDEHDLADEEVVEVNEAVEVWVWVLLHGELDVASQREPPRFSGASVGGFHDAWSSTGHDAVAGSRE